MIKKNIWEAAKNRDTNVFFHCDANATETISLYLHCNYDMIHGVVTKEVEIGGRRIRPGVKGNCRIGHRSLDA